MTRFDPASAPPRTDLPWLRHRRPAVVGPEAGRAPATPAAPAPPTPPPAVSEPTSGNALDLASPAPTLERSSLSAPAPAATAHPLDLGPPPSSSLPPTRAAAPMAPADAPPGYRPRRVAAGEDVVLTRGAPTLTLTRLQSGTGSLRVRLVASPTAGDVLLGCAYQLTDGTSIVRRVPGPSTAPPDGRRPVIRASAEGGEVLTVDLVQVRRLSRMVVYAYSATGQPLQWGGTLVVEMLAGTRVQVPLDRAPGAGVLVPLSVYAVDGELVLRNEGVLVEGPVRAAAAAFGFDRITWVDDHTPLV